MNKINVKGKLTKGPEVSFVKESCIARCKQKIDWSGMLPEETVYYTKESGIVTDKSKITGYLRISENVNREGEKVDIAEVFNNDSNLFDSKSKSDDFNAERKLIFDDDSPF